MWYLRKVLKFPARLVVLSLLVVVFIGCKSNPVPAPSEASPLSTIPISVPDLPPIRPLTTDVFSRAAPEALQYYISAWVILEYVGIPPYPDTIAVKNATTHQEGPVKVSPARTPQGEVVEQSYQFAMRDFPAVNPSGVGHIQYENLNRVILIKEQTRGVLLNNQVDEADGRRVLEIGFEENNNNTLAFKADPSGEYFYLSPGGNGTEIQYGSHPYRQLMRVRPLLRVRIDENIDRTLKVYTVEGRIPRAETGSAGGTAGR